jgi:nitrite reductase/ring-hydroxylating ferredoxin subunit
MSMPFQKAIKAAEVPEGSVAKAVVGTRELAITNQGGRFYALDAGPLGEGTLDGEELVCPWHEGRYRIDTGEANPETDWITDVKAFPVKVEDGYVWVDL